MFKRKAEVDTDSKPKMGRTCAISEIDKVSLKRWVDDNGLRGDAKSFKDIVNEIHHLQKLTAVRLGGNDFVCKLACRATVYNIIGIFLSCMLS